MSKKNNINPYHNNIVFDIRKLVFKNFSLSIKKFLQNTI